VRVGDERAPVSCLELELEGELDEAGAADLVEGLKPPLAPSEPDCSFVLNRTLRYAELTRAYLTLNPS